MKTSLGSDRYPNGRKRPPSPTIPTSSGVNRKFHKLGLSFSGAKKNATKKYRALRDLKQTDFSTMSRWTEARCKKYLTNKGFLGSRWSRKCFACRQSLISVQNQADTLRCANSKCPQLRPRTSKRLELLFVLCVCFDIEHEQRPTKPRYQLAIRIHSLPSTNARRPCTRHARFHENCLLCICESAARFCCSHRWTVP